MAAWARAGSRGRPWLLLLMGERGSARGLPALAERHAGAGRHPEATQVAIRNDTTEQRRQPRARNRRWIEAVYSERSSGAKIIPDNSRAMTMRPGRLIPASSAHSPLWESHLGGSVCPVAADVSSVAKL